MGNYPEIAMGEHLRTPVGFRPAENRKLFVAVDIPRDDKSVLMGIGNATTRASVSTNADKHFFNMFTETTAVSGDSRGIYWQHYLSGVGVTGDCARFATRVNAAGVAGAYGVHATVAVDASMNVTGLANGVRATLEVAADTRSVGGTLAALQVDSYIGAGNTMPATSSFIRVTDVGSVKLLRAFEFAVTPGATTCVGASRSAAGGTDNYLKVRVDGVDKEIPIWPGAAVKDAMGALLWGEGSSSTRQATATADKCFIKMFTESSATSGDSRGIYWHHWLSGNGQTGDCARLVCNVTAATASGAFGIHGTAAIKIGGGITGLANGIRATLEAEDESRVLTGTLSALQVDSFIGAGNTFPAQTSFIRVADSGAVKIGNLFSVAAGSSCITGSPSTLDSSLQVYIEGTGLRYIGLYTTV